MTSTIAPSPRGDTVGELLSRLGDIPPHRVLLRPAPGTATEADVVAMDDHHDRLCELVDGTLVEKGMGLRESIVAMMLGELLSAFVRARKLGLVSGEAGMMKLLPGLVRIPDIAYFSWARMPGGRLPSQPVPEMAPDLAVEVLSESNTKKEMIRKRREYFEAGVRLVWEVDINDRTVAVYTPGSDVRLLGESETLDGGAVLPGFNVLLKELFSALDAHGAPQA